MPKIDRLTVAEIEIDEEGGHFNPCFETTGMISFLLAGTILFASLVVGSSVSLLSIGSHSLTSAILHGFLTLGLWASGGFLAALVLSVVAILICQRLKGDQIGTD